jgi:PAS domain S-box-containing protein
MADAESGPNLRPYQALLEDLSEGVALINRDYVYEFANQSYADRAGVLAEDVSGLTATEMFGQVYFESVIKPLLDVSFVGQTNTIWGWYEMPKRGRSYLRITVRPYRMADGEIAGAFVYVRDETDEKIVSDALAESERAYRTISEHSPDLIGRLALDSRHLYVNQTLANYLGLPTEQIIGKTNQELGVPEDAQEEFDQLRARVVENRAEVTFEIDYPTALGDRYLLVQMVPELDDQGVVQSLLSVGRDITARVQAENSLRLSEERLRSLFERTEDVIWSWDLTTDQFLYINPAAQQVSGRPVADFLADSRLWFEMIHPDDQTAIRQSIVETLQGSRNHWKYRIVRPDGEIRWLQAHPWVVIDGEWNPRRIEGITRDVTAVHLAEERAFQLALEQERTKLLTTFINNASHEFRTPLAVIQLNADLIGRTKETAQCKERITRIKEQVAGLVRLVDMMQHITELESVGLPEWMPVNIPQLMHNLLESLPGDYAHAIEVAYLAPEESLAVMGDATFLRRAVGELVNNARRFSPPSSLISIQAGRTEDQVWLEVRDTGPGISEERLPHLFDTFWRQDDAHTTPGFGLGLPIVQRVAALHRGQVSVDSCPGQGTTFRLTFPGAELT